MSTLFLHPPRKTYYYRSVVPKHLRSLLNGREQIWRSLKTADKDEAQARSAAWESRVQHLFLSLRRHGDKMTNEEREALVTQLGILDEALVLHSLRHGGISKLTGAGCPHNVCEMLAGHAAAGVHGQVYVHRESIPLSLLREGLERLTYPNVVAALTKGTHT